MFWLLSLSECTIHSAHHIECHDILEGDDPGLVSLDEDAVYDFWGTTGW